MTKGKSTCQALQPEAPSTLPQAGTTPASKALKLTARSKPIRKAQSTRKQAGKADEKKDTKSKVKR